MGGFIDLQKPRTPHSDRSFFSYSGYFSLTFSEFNNSAAHSVKSATPTRMSAIRSHGKPTASRASTNLSVVYPQTPAPTQASTWTRDRTDRLLCSSSKGTHRLTTNSPQAPSRRKWAAISSAAITRGMPLPIKILTSLSKYPSLHRIWTDSNSPPFRFWVDHPWTRTAIFPIFYFHPQIRISTLFAVANEAR